MDVQNVLFHVFFDDIPRRNVVAAFDPAQSEAFVLSHGVVVDPLVFADDFAVQRPYLPLFHRKVGG